LAGQRSIGIVSPSFHPMIGGVELYVKGVGSELARLGYDVHVYTPDRVMGKKMDEKEEVVDGINVHRLSVLFELSYRIKAWPGLRGALERGGHDLIHVYSHDSYARPSAKAAGSLGRPLIITTYGPFETHSDYGAAQRLLFRLYDSYVTPSLLRKCAYVMVRYPEILDWVRSMGVGEPMTKVEPSGIPRSYLKENGDSGRNWSKSEGPTILYLGRISPQKGVQYAVEAMEHVVAKFPTATLALVGPDYVGYTRHLVALAERLGIKENIAFLAPVIGEEAEGALLSDCDVFVMPSSFEGFSQGVMKAMAHGRPVVVTRVGGLPFEVDYGRCGAICEFADPKSLAESVIDVLESPERASAMSSKARKRAGEFTFDRLASSLSKTYESVLTR